VPHPDRIAVENMPGEGGLAGVRHANALAAAGVEPVLLLATPSTHILLPARLGASAAPDDSFAPLLGLGSAPNVLLVSARLDVRTLEEFVARARSGDLAYASAGAGQTIHVCSAYFCSLAGIRMAHRPYDAGSAHAYPDLAAGRVHAYFDNVLACREAIARGDVRPLAISSPVRHRLLPHVPTLAESGFPDHVLDIWFGVFAAGGSRPDLRAIEGLRTGTALRERLRDVGLGGEPLDAFALEREIGSSRERWRNALAAAG